MACGITCKKEKELELHVTKLENCVGLRAKKEIVGVLHVKNELVKEVRGWNYVQNCKKSKIARNLDK